MSPNSLCEDDSDIYALEKLLAAAETEEVKGAPTAVAAEQTIRNVVPRLCEDSTFADAFSYELEPPTGSKIVIPTNGEDNELDSSDDEEVKNFLERKYNEYGCGINKKLKQQAAEKREAQVAREVAMHSARSVSDGSSVGTNSPSSCAIKNPHNPKMRQSLLSNSFKKAAPQEVANRAEQHNNTSGNFTSPSTYKQINHSIYTDPVFGMRLINPLISSAVMTERMAGRKPVPFAGLAFHIERGDLSKDWVIAGVLVSKSPIKTAKNGSLFSIWKLSDLRGEIKMISLFLFKSAHKELWKTSTGMALAILNPSVLDKRAESGDAACLSIDTAHKVMILGQSKDFGVCKAKKKNGDPCTATINLNDCDFCIFHMKQEFGKMSKRSELQSSTSGRGLNELRNKVLGKSEVFYGGQSYTAIPAKKSAKLVAKDSQRLMSLSEYAMSPNAGSINHLSASKEVKAIQYAARGGPVSKLATNVEASTKQRLKDIERLKILQAESSPKTPEADRSIPTTTTKPTDTIKDSVSVPEKFKNREFSFAQRSPQLNRENFSLEINIGDRKAELAKLKAMQILKKKPIQKVDPNFIKYRGTSDGKKRAIDFLNEKFDNPAKRQKLDEEQREADRKSRIQRIIDATSSHTNLVEYREMQEQEKYFNKLEKKEALEEKMLNTYKMPCKAVSCLDCKYTAFSAADRCKEEKHRLRVIDTEKRFFKCKDCGYRTTTVHKLPSFSCKNCKSSRWERAAMIRERKIVDGTEGLSIRGDEETFIGSLCGKANLNLMVPDE